MGNNRYCEALLNRVFSSHEFPYLVSIICLLAVYYHILLIKNTAKDVEYFTMLSVKNKVNFLEMTELVFFKAFI